MSTIRFWYTRPVRTMMPVDSMLSIILVAVPAFNRVEPLNTSGPVGASLQAELGVASCCGCCAQTASEYLPKDSASNAANQEYVSESRSRKALVSTALW